MFNNEKKSKQIMEELSILLPRLNALADRTQMIDDIHHRMNLLETILHNLNELANASTLLVTAKEVVTRYLDENHRISEDVHIDVETISALTLKIQKDLQDLSRRLNEFDSRLSR